LETSTDFNVAAASKEAEEKEDDADADLLYFETAEKRVNVPYLQESKKSSPTVVASSVKYKADAFSFAPGKSKREAETIVPAVSVEVEEEENARQHDDENLFDQQYRADIAQREGGLQRDIPSAAEVFREQKATTEEDKTNEIDRQYFGNLEGNLSDVDQRIEVDEEEAKKTRELVRVSTTDLGYIDAQMFGQQLDSRKAKNDLPADSQSGEKRHSKPTRVKKSLVQRPYTPAASTALAYVQQLRKREKDEAGGQTKENEVSLLGVGVAKRLDKVSGGLEVIGDDIAQRMSQLRKVQQGEGAETKFKAGEGLRLNLADKFKPTSLSDLTSIEVERILKDSIVYDGRKFIWILLIRGAP
jgi:hypothetical protein